MIYDVELDSPEVDVSNLLSVMSLVDISVGLVSTTSTAESNIISVLLLLMLLEINMQRGKNTKDYALTGRDETSK